MKSFQIWDRSGEPSSGDALEPFAYEEWLLGEIGYGRLPAGVHLWRHRRALVLGLRDARLPGAPKAMRWFEREGWSIAVRHSGGALVPLDDGVVNVALLLPNPDGRFAHREDFRRLAGWIAEAAAEACGLATDVGEIAGAYCPGEFDLSAAGRKYAGLAQRRALRASTVQAFVVVAGEGRALADAACRFYSIAREDSGEDGYPPAVDPAKTASLAELAGGTAVTVESFVQAFKRVLVRCGGAEVPSPMPPAGEIERLTATMRERYGRSRSAASANR
ncbi:MAG: hypothetical protein BLM47_05240 [Candidatus Reconcilbacillus cellulovorans]|uniref:BPL/LPL catalytic domain-containing protein n=1 Tax=Candidatus Reconcilbacillus cellulovorans TaxID=1906605 RepID=A0A2A6E1R2_9BACL|nr:MAG: hypothetical protein BLM47_05240 [Candidatus Reconcilbacillus cellulovorans]